MFVIIDTECNIQCINKTFLTYSWTAQSVEMVVTKQQSCSMIDGCSLSYNTAIYSGPKHKNNNHKHVYINTKTSIANY